MDQAGWGFTGASRKAHYFVGGMSLCRKWGFYLGSTQDDNHDSPDNCTECRRIYKRQQSVAQESSNDR